MKKRYKDLLKQLIAISFLSFLLSYVISLIGVILTAFSLGYDYDELIKPLKRKRNWLTVKIFLAMETGFLGSSLLHAGLFPGISTLITVIIGITVGFFFFVFGCLLEKYKKKKRKATNTKKFNWYYLKMLMT
jgi:hypothetical protein